MGSELDPRNEDKNKRSPRILNRKVFYKGDTLFKQGDEAYSAYYIEDGMVEIFVQQEGYEVKISEQGRGSVVGEMALIDPAPRSATVRALTDCTVSVIAKEDLEQKIEAIDNKATKALFHIMVERIRMGNRGQVEHFKNLAQFQDRISGLVENVSKGIDSKKRQEFREEVTPVLDMLEKILEKYARP